MVQLRPGVNFLFPFSFSNPHCNCVCKKKFLIQTIKAAAVLRARYWLPVIKTCIFG